MEFQKILIGIDDSKYADNAASYGFELAHKFNARVALVNTVEPVPVSPMNDTSMMGALIPSLSTGVDDVEIMNIQEQHSHQVLDDIITKYGQGLEVSQYSEFGGTADSIINCAAQFGADLIVIGTHSRTGLDRLLMGSISEDVVRHSPVPVLVVPMKDADKA